MKTSFLYQFIAYPFLDCNEKNPILILTSVSCHAVSGLLELSEVFRISNRMVLIFHVLETAA